METKFINLEIKAAEDDADENSIIGMGSVYGNIDRGGDVVLAGAFAESLATGRKIKMLYQHNPTDVIGVWHSVTEVDGGLRVEGKFADTPRAQEVRSLVKMGAIDGLSIGYRTVESEYSEQGHRLISKADLWEVSVVTFPMNEAATVTSVKSDDENEAIISLLHKRIALLKA